MGKKTDAEDLEYENSKKICNRCGNCMVITFRFARNGRKMLGLQCQKCGSWGGFDWRHTQERLKRAIPFNIELQNKIFEGHKRKKELYDARKTNIDYFERHRRYEEYLQSKEWKMTRLKRLTMDKMRCSVCGNSADCVHHITYDRLFNENLSDLISLCNECHANIHGGKL